MIQLLVKLRTTPGKIREAKEAPLEHDGHAYVVVTTVDHKNKFRTSGAHVSNEIGNLRLSAECDFSTFIQTHL